MNHPHPVHRLYQGFLQSMKTRILPILVIPISIPLNLKLYWNDNVFPCIALNFNQLTIISQVVFGEFNFLLCFSNFSTFSCKYHCNISLSLRCAKPFQISSQLYLCELFQLRHQLCFDHSLLFLYYQISSISG